MSASRILCVVIATAAFNGRAGANSLEITIRPHSREVTFGDPLYVEVTITNRGEEVIVAQPPHPALRTFEFKVYDPETDLEVGAGEGGGFGGGDLVRYEPGKPVKHYWRVFLPVAVRLNHPFWIPMRSGRNVYVSGVYHLGKGYSVRSRREEVYIRDRDESELKTLERWGTASVENYERLPHVASFGLNIPAVNRQQTLEVASDVKSGNVADLFHLTIQLQDIFQSPPNQREPLNRALVDWLKNQPAIKRQTLINEVHTVAVSHNLVSTVKALEPLVTPP
jgi:hypothetical protein